VNTDFGPALATVRESARVVSLPMRTAFRGITTREALLFEGPVGWAEWSPFAEYPDAEASVWLRGALEYAFEAAPPTVRGSVGVNATLPAVAPGLIAKTLEPFGIFRTVKVKVAEKGESLEQDLARVTEVHRLFPDARIRIDANGGYTQETAIDFATRLADLALPIEYLEQPVATVAELRRVRESVNPLGILVAADESIRKADDPLEVARSGAADLIVVKAAPLGGIRTALGITAQTGLPAVVSSALDTSIGLGMGLHLATALLQLDYDCGLGTSALFEEDICDEPLLPVNGVLELRRPTPSVAKLTKYAANEQRSSWWLDRLERCAKLL